MKVVLFCYDRIEPLLTFDASENKLRELYYHPDPNLRIGLYSVLDRVPAFNVTISLQKLSAHRSDGHREWFIAFLSNFTSRQIDNGDLANLKIALNNHFK